MIEEYDDEYINEISCSTPLDEVSPERMDEVPHKHIGSLSFDFLKGAVWEKGVASGILISPNLVLTCAHNAIS